MINNSNNISAPSLGMSQGLCFKLEVIVVVGRPGEAELEGQASSSHASLETH